MPGEESGHWPDAACKAEPWFHTTSLSLHLHELLQSAHAVRRPLRLGRSVDGSSTWLHLSVVDPALVMGLALGARRCVLATLFSPAHMTPLDPFAMGQMFELTPAESRIAALLGEALEPVAIAARLNVQLSTARSHLRKVLTALGQKRMTDAVRVLRQGEALWAPPPGGRMKRPGGMRGARGVAGLT